jgi:hypothetical protein
MPRTTIIEVANFAREIEQEMLTPHNNKWSQPLLDNEDSDEEWMMMIRKRKQGKDTWIVMMDIDVEYFVKNVIMKANWQKNPNFYIKFATSTKGKGMKWMISCWRTRRAICNEGHTCQCGRTWSTCQTK